MILDSVTEIAKLDLSNEVGSIRALPHQLIQAFDEVSKIEIPQKFKNVRNILVCGMGGSALGGRILASLLYEKITVPLEVSTNYNIPAYIDKNSLVILSSYSGNTEETIEATHESISRGANIFVVATGGKLSEIAKAHSLSSYIFDPINNPSGQPRMSLGYSLGAILTLFAKCGLAQFGKDEVHALTKVMNKTLSQFDIENPLEGNTAKLMAKKLRNKIPVLISSEHLWGVTHAFKNQLNENAKTFTCVFDIPELNHHLLEGLKFPPEAKEVLYFVFLKSKLYSPRVVKRFEITSEVIEKNDYPHSSYELTSSTKMEQVFESLIFGSFVNYYLAMLYGIDPTPIPWVDYFKEKMGR